MRASHAQRCQRWLFGFITWLVVRSTIFCFSGWGKADANPEQRTTGLVSSAAGLCKERKGRGGGGGGGQKRSEKPKHKRSEKPKHKR